MSIRSSGPGRGSRSIIASLFLHPQAGSQTHHPCGPMRTGTFQDRTISRLQRAFPISLQCHVPEPVRQTQNTFIPLCFHWSLRRSLCFAWQPCKRVRSRSGFSIIENLPFAQGFSDFAAISFFLSQSGKPGMLLYPFVSTGAAACAGASPGSLLQVRREQIRIQQVLGKIQLFF